MPPENSFCVSCGFAMTAPPAAPPGGAPPPAAPGAVPPPAAPYMYGAPPPGYYPYVRQATVSNMLSGTFDVWTKNFLPFFLVYVVVTLVTGFLGLAGSYFILGVSFVSGGLLGATPTVSDLAAFAAYEVVVGIISWVVGSLVLGGVVDFSIRRYRCETVRIQDSLSRGFQRVLSIMGANLLVTVITLGVVILWLVVLLLGAVSLIAAGGVGGGVLAVCGALIALPFVLVIVLYIDIALSLYAPAIMSEGAHAVDSLGRSWNLTKGHKWSLFGAGLVLGIIILVVEGVIGTAGALAGNAIVEVVVAALAAGIVGSWWAILTAVAYDLIVRSPQHTVWPPAYAPPYPPR